VATRGKFITFEGPEGGGKTTQAVHLCRSLGEMGVEVFRFREPGGTPTGEAIRDILQHAAARLLERTRNSGSGPDRIERESHAFHQAVRDGYLELARREPGRFVMVEASGAEAEVQNAIWSHVERLLHG
jgi:dTMP kinase